MIKKYHKLTKEEQAQFADTVIGMLVSRCWRDTTTDPTGYTITKEQLGKHAGKVMQDIKQGALQPIKSHKGFKL